MPGVCKMLFTRSQHFCSGFHRQRNLSDQVHTGGPPCLTSQNSSRFCIAKVVERQSSTITQKDYESSLSSACYFWDKKEAEQMRSGVKKKKRGPSVVLQRKKVLSSKLIRAVGSECRNYTSASSQVVWIIICHEYGHRSDVCRSSYFHSFSKELSMFSLA